MEVKIYKAPFFSEAIKTNIITQDFLNKIAKLIEDNDVETINKLEEVLTKINK